MPLLFYFPLIIWAGVFSVAADAMRPQATADARKPPACAERP